MSWRIPSRRRLHPMPTAVTMIVATMAEHGAPFAPASAGCLADTHKKTARSLPAGMQTGNAPVTPSGSPGRLTRRSGYGCGDAQSILPTSSMSVPPRGTWRIPSLVALVALVASVPPHCMGSLRPTARHRRDRRRRARGAFRGRSQPWVLTSPAFTYSYFTRSQ